MGKFGTAINCMDGRVQLPVIEYFKKEYGIDCVDMITEPGPDKILAEALDESLIESIRQKVNISVSKHGSEIIVIAGHYDCAGNPTTEEKHKEQIKKSIETIKGWDLPVKTIVGLWIDKDFQPTVL
jgi:hypothetical protein